MPKKLTIEFVRERFEKENYILLTKKYINSVTPLDYVCPKNHEGSIIWSSWRCGHRCAKCAGLKKLTVSFIREEFEKEGYILLTEEYINSKVSLEYICPKGHRWSISWNNWQRGYRCPRCSKRGTNNPNYNPDLTEEHRMYGRFVQGYKEWNYAVKERDNFTCQICGDNRGGNLVSHHLYGYMSYPELRTTLSNGVCLCEKCHKAFHYKYGYGNSTKEQFEEFRSMLWHTFCIYTSVLEDKYD